MNLNLAQQLELPHETGTPAVIIQGPLKESAFPKGGLTIGGIINSAVPFIFGFAGLALLIMLIAGGFGVLTSAGDAKKLASASQRLTYAILGFLVIFVAYFLVQILGRVFGLPEIQQTFGK